MLTCGKENCTNEATWVANVGGLQVDVCDKHAVEFIGLGARNLCGGDRMVLLRIAEPTPPDTSYTVRVVCKMNTKSSPHGTQGHEVGLLVDALGQAGLVTIQERSVRTLAFELLPPRELQGRATGGSLRLYESDRVWATETTIYLKQLGFRATVVEQSSKETDDEE